MNWKSAGIFCVSFLFGIHTRAEFPVTVNSQNYQNFGGKLISLKICSLLQDLSSYTLVLKKSMSAFNCGFRVFYGQFKLFCCLVAPFLLSKE